MSPIWKRGIGIAALVLAPVIAAASPRYDRAAAALAAGRCDDAATGFAAEVAERGWSVPALVDLGDAYACGGHPGRALVRYEQARLLAPRDVSITAKIDALDRALGRPSPPRAVRASSFVGERAWTWLAIGSTWAALGLLALAVRRPRAAIAAAVCLAITATSAAGIAILDDAERAAIVVHKSAAIRVSPFEAADVTAQATEGTRLEVLGERSGWRHVRDGDGRSGWVAPDDTERISN